ncbi:MAG: sulfite exporter TauE/SafE family protein [Gemmatimonadaceae bacterium]|nr:sulfite exporter TauE/SafE family protein [Gemmatimonadaceae bacterium]
MPDLPTALLITIAFFLAGGVKGIIGMGLPAIALAILTLQLPPATAAAVLVMPSLATNVWQAVDGGSLGPIARRLAPMLVGLCVGTAFGIPILTGSSSATVLALLGALFAIYGLAGVSRVRLHVPATSERWLAPLIGVATGGLTGATGVFMIPSVPYIGALGLDRTSVLQAMGLSFSVSTAALGVALALRGAFTMHDAMLSVAALVPTAIGMVLGRRVRHRLSEPTFRRWFFVSIIALGGHMVWRAMG